MGRLIKSHLARLLSLSAAACTLLYHCPHVTPYLLLICIKDQFAAAIQGFFWPKAFFDFSTKTLDAAVKPIPYLQIANLLCSLLIFTWEWPARCVAGTVIHSSPKFRVPVLFLAAVPAMLLYQGTNAAIYYLVALAVYVWAYTEGEVCIFPQSMHLVKLLMVCMTQAIYAHPWTVSMNSCSRQEIFLLGRSSHRQSRPDSSSGGNEIHSPVDVY